MSNSKDNPPPIVPPLPTETTDDAQARETPSGRTTFDSNGNAVWEWRTQSGGFSRDIGTQQLKTLEAPELRIEQTSNLPQLTGLSPKDRALAGRAYNPYDRTRIKTTKPATNEPVVARSPSKPVAETPRGPVNASTRWRV